MPRHAAVYRVGGVRVLTVARRIEEGIPTCIPRTAQHDRMLAHTSLDRRACHKAQLISALAAQPGTVTAACLSELSVVTYNHLAQALHRARERMCAIEPTLAYRHQTL